MPDVLSEPARAGNYSQELYQAELAWDNRAGIHTIKKPWLQGLQSL